VTTRIVAAAVTALLASGVAGAEERLAIDYPSVAAARAALRADPAAQFEEQAGWTLVATNERGNPVLWSFTPEGHPAHPAVVKRTALEDRGTGFVELDTLCEGPEQECKRLLERFRQVSQRAAESARTLRVELDVGLSLGTRSRVHVKRMIAEEGKAAEIRVDGVGKVVIVPSWDEQRGVMLWTAPYEFDGSDFRLLARPQLVAAGVGTARIEVAASSGQVFGFSITPSLADTSATEAPRASKGD